MIIQTIAIAGIVGGLVGGVVATQIPLREVTLSHVPTTTPILLSASSTDALTLDRHIADLVERVSPSVVSITISKERRLSRREMSVLDEDFMLEQGDSLTERIGGGSGFFVSGDGYIVTNRHVIDDPKAEYLVVTQDGKEHKAVIAAVDPVLDLGFLKIEGTNFPALELGDSDAIRIGQSVIAIGNALAEFENSVTRGIISGLNRRLQASSDMGAEMLEEAIQTDAAINPGNSGGPLLDLTGKVIGVNTAVTDGAQSLGFALPSNAIKRAVDSVRQHGRIIRPWIGVRYIQVDEEYAKRHQLSHTYGALILRGITRGDSAIIPGSPADKAGIKENDLLLELNGKKLDIKHPLSAQVARLSPGEKVTIKLLREGKELEIQVQLEERKEIR